ncbi:MAG TPA: hypothetical protein V6C81_29580 [Planktothrix sp.]|jgi:hypothetical protein
MYKTLLSAIVVLGLSAPSAMAQNANSSVGNIVSGIVNGITGNSNGLRNGLPGTSTDSFVYEAGGSADLIYGDEGTDDIPPYFEFTKDNRINAGIFGQRDAGLTTGHGSFLPDAWGGDEWTGNEWDQSGAYNAIPQGGNGLTIGIGGTGVNVGIGLNGVTVGDPALGIGATVTGNGGDGVNVGVGVGGGVVGGATIDF